ncbi:MAG: oligoribonuclease, partial [Glaciecola sp.]|nr:oligoribonuclease [Glaciecola sp.]
MSQATLSPQNNDSNLIWIDMEMTGLDPDTCVVL